MKLVQISLKEYTDMHTERVEFLNLVDKTWLAKFSVIAQLTPKPLRLKLGSPAFKYRGSEFITDNWIFEFDGSIFVVASANVRGTTVEMSQPVDAQKAEHFAESFIQLLGEEENLQKWITMVTKKKRSFLGWKI